MKHLTIKFFLIMVIISLMGCGRDKDPASWSDNKIDKWFEKSEWLNGWSVKPDPSINRKTFAISYFEHKDRWDAAFSFLKSNDLTKLESGRHEINGDNVYAMVNDYDTRDGDKPRFEAHRQYIDVQYMVTGKELIGLAPLSYKTEVTHPYEEEGDYELFYVKDSEMLKASPESFFIFFPDEAHAPGLKDGNNMSVRKVVVKVKVD